MNIPAATSDHPLLADEGYQRRLADDLRVAELCLSSVRRGLVQGENPDRRHLGENLVRVVEEQLYEFGSTFRTFSEWVLGAQPRGLQLRDAHTAKRLRWELLEVDLHGAWAELLPHIVREPGRPKRLVDSDDFNRFWRADSSDTGVDRRIMKLYRTRPDIYDRLVARTITWAQAIQEADFERSKTDKLLRDLMAGWKKAGPETRAVFLEWINGPARFR